MRKDQLKLRTNNDASTISSDGSDTEENRDTNNDNITSDDPFDSLLNSDAKESPKKTTNGAPKIPSPIPDDSDTEKEDDTQIDAEPLDESTVKSDAENTENDEKDDDKDKQNESTNDDDEENQDDDYEVEAIVGHRIRNDENQYRVKWKNYPDSDNTWENESNLNCSELIAEYLEKNPPKPKKEKKVRISLQPTREAPKRSVVERKSMVESDQESGDDDDKTNKSPKKKANGKKSPKNRGRPTKTTTKKSKETEYEVAKVVDDEMRSGKKYYRIRWKGYGAKDDTWEPKSSLNCPDKIKEYEDSKVDDTDYEVEKIMGEKIEAGCRYFLIKWKNWPESDNTWQSADEVSCDDLIEKWRDSCRSTAPSKPAKAAASKPTKPAEKRPAKKSNKSKSPAKKAKKEVNDDEERDPLADDDDEDNEDSKQDQEEEDEEEEEEREWEVKEILKEQKRKGKETLYLIRWKGCDASQDTWEPESGINCPKLLAAFKKKSKK